MWPQKTIEDNDGLSALSNNNNPRRDKFCIDAGTAATFDPKGFPGNLESY
jgi:hypothetical protein